MASNVSFAKLVSLACHDLRTPLATVSGFAHTMERLEEVQPPADRYVEMIRAGAEQMADLLEDLALAARIEDGRYEPRLGEVDSRELVEAAADRAGKAVTASGAGGVVQADREPLERALAALASCAAKHGGVEVVEVTAAGAEVTIAPIAESAAPVVLAEELKDLGAAVARRLIESLGGSLALQDQTLRVRLPS